MIEKDVKKLVSKLLKKYGAYYHMPVQNGMGMPTLDYIGCFKGKFFGIETKAPGKHPTPRQEITIGHMKQAGAMVFVIDGDTSALLMWLELVE